MRPALTLARSLASARLARSTATLLPRAAILAPLRSRSLHVTRPSLASEVPKDPTADPELQSFYDKIVKHQGAVDAMLEIQKLMQEKGIDTSKPISRFQVLKLGMDEDMRTAGMKFATPRAAGIAKDANTMQLVEELKNAGVELTPESMQMLVKKMGPGWSKQEE
ncbi:hypothetical protein JCM24511_00357 [Saitozyma sp. JCM 24511]|nr:hypothetical protein JCM24511_00357 [Saitozyma sp. JCM 24511]